MAKPILNSDILTAALIGFEVQKARIDTQIAEIRSQLDGGREVTDVDSDSGKPRRKVSAKARRRMAKAQKLRWKKAKQASGPAAETASQKRVMSPSARKAISAAQKARWAAKKTGPAKKRAKASASEQAASAGA